jgi:hypothetical protein
MYRSHLCALICAELNCATIDAAIHIEKRGIDASVGKEILKHGTPNMMTIAYLISEEDVHAYVDSALDARRQQAVEICLSQDSELAAKVAVYRAQVMALKLLDRPSEPLSEPIRALCRVLAQRITQRSQLADIWDKIPPKRTSKSSARG